VNKETCHEFGEEEVLTLQSYSHHLDVPFPGAQITKSGEIYNSNSAFCDLIQSADARTHIDKLIASEAAAKDLRKQLALNKFPINNEMHIKLGNGQHVSAALSITQCWQSKNLYLWINQIKSLEIANDRLRTLFLQTPCPIIVCCSKDGRILKQNDQALHEFGPVTFITELIGDQDYQELSDTLKTQEATSQNIKVTKDGNSRQVHAKRIDLINGQAFILDFKALDQEMDQDVDFFEYAPVPMLLADFDDRSHVIKTNRRAREVFIDGSNEADSNLRLKNILGLRNFLQIVQKLTTSGFIDDFEIEISTAYGEQVACLLNGCLLGQGDKKFIQLSISDITERKEAQETLSRFFSAAPLPMILARLRDSKVELINHRAAELFVRHDNIKFRDMTVHELLGKKDTDAFLSRLKGGGFIDDFELKIETPYGEIIWGLLSGQYLRANNEECVLIGINDISERKQMESDIITSREKALLATKQKSMFLSTMSHEIRTPMTGVLGMLELLNLTNLDGEQQEAVRVVKESATSLLTIIDDILDFSKIEAGRLSIETVEFNLRDVVEGACDLMGGRARSKGLELICFMDPKVPGFLFGDPTRIRQILLNLISNAIKFTQTGTVVCHVTGKKVTKKKANIHFAIIDQGIGISEEKQKLLFNPFQQTDESTTRKFGGTGLGLSICKALSELMNGSIGIESEEGNGSTFWFELELLRDVQEVQEEDTSLADKAILLHQNQEMAFNSIAETLKKSGAQVTAAKTFKDIHKALNKQSYDLLLLDHGESEPETIQAISDAVAAGLTAEKIILTRIDNSDGFKSSLDQLKIAAAPLKPMKSTSLLKVAQSVVKSQPLAQINQQEKSKEVMTRDEAIKQNKLILFADDVATNRLVIGKQLNKLGYAYDVAKDGLEALNLYKENPYALVLSDVRMPEMSGHLLSLSIRKIEKDIGDGRHIPILALTANAAPEDAEACKSAGMDDYLVKPLTFEKLGKAMQQWLPLEEEPQTEAKQEETKSAPTDHAAIDLNALADVLGTDDPEFLFEILEFFNETFEELISDLDEHSNVFHPDKLGDAAHSAKGAALNAGAKQLGDIMQELEKTVGTIEQDQAKVLVQHAKDEFKNVKSFINNMQGETKDGTG
jgi:signal transduction histidine kinase/CheY-like chemotaxis protein/HPt (histidine-containing phosphotransfer) domain-containing protein